MEIEHSTNANYLALYSLYLREGKQLTAAAVLEEATNEDSVLHDAFEWDDNAAAHLYRISQAYKLIERYTVKIVREDRDPIRVRAFVHEPQTSTYGAAEDVVLDSDRRAAQVERMRSQYVRMANRASAYDEFAEVVAATRETLGVAVT